MAEEGAGRDAVPGFGERVKEAREAKGLTQAALAELAESHFTTVSKLEKGERNASLQLALRISDALGVSINKLIPPDWKEQLKTLQGRAAAPTPKAAKKKTK